MVIFWRLILAYLINEFIIGSNFLGYWKSCGFKKILLRNAIFLILAFGFNFQFINNSTGARAEVKRVKFSAIALEES